MRPASPITRSSFLHRETASHTGRARERITSRRGWRRDGPAHETRVTLWSSICTNGLRREGRPERQPGASRRDHAALSFVGREGSPLVQRRC